MWSEKYRPKNVKHIVGNEEERITFLEWLSNWKNGSKPILLVGPPGIGKTTLVKAAVIEFGYDVVELNASDVRTKDKLQSIIPSLLNNTSILGKKTLLFLDEVDGMSARSDRGGFAALMSLLKNPAVPIVLAANAEVGEQIKELKRISTIIKFKRIAPRLLTLYLDNILKMENVKVSIENKIRMISVSNGDVRTLMNEAQSFTTTGFSQSIHQTNFSIDIDKAVTDFFSADSVEDALDILMRSEGFYNDPRFPGYDTEKRRRDKLVALFSSIVTSKVDLERMTEMLNALAYTDIIIGRMGRTRQWRLLRYIDTIIAYKLFKESRGLTYNQYDIPFVLMNRVFREARLIRTIISTFAKNTHMSKRKAASYLPYFLFILARSKIDLEEFLTANNMDTTLKELLKGEMNKLVKVNKK
ncbi:MAG: replication protein C [Thaumarchaeota archaeon]|nr:replication protein C [Nitrososphaerota archaeon]|tara:strand:- start:677 stop:1918 length:1242 start_codon:yes stop_codon:yes gene_type:complete